MHWMPANHTPIEEQGRIAGKLDCWQELTRERELGQKQFEYHPDKMDCQTLHIQVCNPAYKPILFM